MITLQEAIKIANSIVPWCKIEQCWDLGDGWVFNHYVPGDTEYPDLDPTFVFKDSGKAIDFLVPHYLDKWKNRVEIDISTLEN